MCIVTYQVTHEPASHLISRGAHCPTMALYDHAVQRGIYGPVPVALRSGFQAGKITDGKWVLDIVLHVHFPQKAMPLDDIVTCFPQGKR